MVGGAAVIPMQSGSFYFAILKLFTMPPFEDQCVCACATLETAHCQLVKSHPLRSIIQHASSKTMDHPTDPPGTAVSTSKVLVVDESQQLLRQRAEAFARADAPQAPNQAETLLPEATQRTLHELRVLQIELEMQNEELREKELELDAEHQRYFELYEQAPVGYLLVNEKGLLLQANLTARRLLGTQPSARNSPRFTRFICREDQDLYYLGIRQLLSKGEPVSFELRLLTDQGSVHWVQVAVRLATTSSVSSKLDQQEAKVLHMVVSDIDMRKKAEEALREGNEQLRAVFDAVDTGVVLADRNGRILTMNRWWRDKLGYDEAQIANLTILDITHPLDSEISKTQMQRVLAGEVGDYRLRKRFVKKDASHFWGDLVSSGIKDKDNNVSQIVEVVTDITQRKKSGEAARLAAKVFKHALEGIMITTLDGSIVDVNQAFTEITGYSREEALGQSPRILKSGRHSKAYYQQMWRALAQQGVWVGEGWNRRKNGEIYALIQKVSTVRDEQGNAVNYVSLFSDITATKNQQQQLANSQAFNLAIMDSIAEGLVVIDQAGLIIAVNQPWQNMTFQNTIEPSKPMVSGQAGSNFFALCQVGANFSVDEEAIQAREGVKAVLEGRLSHFNFEFASHQASRSRWLSMSASPMGSGDGGAVIAHTDITERKKNEIAAISYQDDLEVMVSKRTNELRALAMELLQTETRERQAVAADLHDDLGQILAVAKLKLSSLSLPGSGVDTSHFLKQLRDVENLIDRCSVSVRSLSTQLSPPALYRQGLTAALEWLAEEMMRTYGLLVELFMGEMEPLDEAVSSALFRMVRELLINVWKHGQVHYAKVTMDMDPDSHTLTIEVADAGAGFEVPSMLKSTANHSYGLFSISERLKLIGGTLHIDSHVGGGTKVTLVVPSGRLRAEFEGAQG